MHARRTVTASPDGRREWLRRPDAQHAAAFILYLVLSLALFGRDALRHPSTECACLGDGDPSSYMWSLVWWPHAILDGLNPLVTDVVWVGEEVNLTQSAVAMPAVSLIAAPITLAAGPLVAFNVLTLLSPVLAAWFTYRLCRYMTGAFAPALVGGYVFGFGTFVAAHMLGHLHLELIFLAPAAVHLALLRLDSAITRRRFVLVMAGLIALQLLISTEMLLAGLGFGAFALLVGYVVSGPERRRRITGIVPAILGAGGLAAVVTSPYLLWGVRGLGDANSEGWRAFTEAYPADALNPIVPTQVTWVGGQWFTSMTTKFDRGALAEATAYVGPFLLAIVVAFAIAHWRQPAARVLLAVILVSYVLALGVELQIGGELTGIPLPWALLHPLPSLDHIIPVRLFVYAQLAIALVLAVWLAQRSGRTPLRWAIAALAVISLLPNLSADYWGGRLTRPAFFTSDLYKAHLREDETVLVLPYAREPMLWQAETDFYFRMPEGRLSAEYPAHYASDPFLPLLTSGAVDAGSAYALRDFIVRRRVTAVILNPEKAGAWPTVLTALSLRPVSTGGVLLYRIPRSWAA